VPDRAQVAPLISRMARPGDLVLTMGAGDVTTLGPELVEALGKRHE
jgi:UDP-N-acetylmuramate--alanine ligase